MIRHSLFVLGLLFLSSGEALAQAERPPSARPQNTSAQASAAANPVVTRDQFNRLIQVFKAWTGKVQSLENRVSALEKRSRNSRTASNDSEEAIDLSTMDSGSPTPEASGSPHGGNTSRASGHGGKNPHGRGISGIDLRALFDLNFYARPGYSGLTFDNFHAIIMAESLPSPELSFQFDVSASPRWYELDWTPLSRFTIRAGKIWIPFDDLSPHNLFGGRVNVTRIMPEPAFLPNLWADLGVGLKWVALDFEKFTLTLDAYAVNGFGSGGTDLLSPGSLYPSLSDTGLAVDNNMGKSFGGRLHMKAFGIVGLGGSFYWGPWTPDGVEQKSLMLGGGDFQFRIPQIGSELRLGLALQYFDLPNGKSTLNAGSYAEIGVSFLKERRMKALVRGGTLQLDQRVINPADMLIVGAGLLYRFKVVELGIEHSQDLLTMSSKKNYSFTNLRLVVAI